MIYGRGSLESRAKKMPSARKSNKHPFWISVWGGGMYRKPFTGWSCIKQTSPPQIFMGRDLLINLSLSSIFLFCIHQELGSVIGYSHLCFTFSCVMLLAVRCWLYFLQHMQQIMRRLGIWVSYSSVAFLICIGSQVFFFFKFVWSKWQRQWVLWICSSGA